MERYLNNQILKDLEKKMVFLGGPRQVGKTTLALQIIDNKRNYLNWDIAEHREKILKRELPPGNLLVFDEIHKYRSWRNYIKGLYDLRHNEQKILITGSARLDLYRFGGDSLQGRYHYLRLHPLSIAELKITKQKDFLALLNLGGFPEPFLGGSQIEAKRWSREYRTRLLQEDILSLERIHDIGNLELLTLRLPELVGSPLSLNALREDLQTSHKTITRWMDVLERTYAIFRLLPFGAPQIRAVKKERKHYHFDWSLIPEQSYRFENMVASHLLKWVHFQEDTEARNLELRYFRNMDGQEVDFVITEDKQPILLIECKLTDTKISRPLKYLKSRFPKSKAWQIHASGSKDYQTFEGIRVCPALAFLRTLI
ncbi:MAG: ATP-binding protein [Candidatus Omnitrophica bacterium]|nr:ATP-binding protein [Candidatus Omnitrophota bacterium]